MQITAQTRLLTFNIVSFEHDQHATTAVSEQYQRYDANGDRYAIIKVMSADPSIAIENIEAFTFNFGMMKHETEVHGDELWVYVQKNARTVDITRDGYAPIKKYALKPSVREGATYVMKITFDHVVTTIKHDINKQIVQVKLTPALSNALVKLTKEGEATASEVLTTDPTGSASTNLPFGKYFYEVSLANYLPKSGSFTLTNSDSTCTVDVALVANFGHLVINDANNAAGAKVFVNNEEIGTVPYLDKRKWDAGTYQLMLVKDMYKPYSASFEIKQGETTTLSPTMVADFAETTLTVGNGADIFIDNRRVGNGTFVGPLKAGSYVVECRKLNHTPTQKRITIEPNMAATIELEAPKPITGHLAVMSTPAGAKLTIDGKDYGVTPKNVADLLIGQHEVTLSLPNMKSETRTVNIEEGKQEELKVTLSSVAKVKFTSSPSYADVYINGTRAGVTPFEYEMSSGEYTIRAAKRKYKTKTVKANINIASPNYRIKLTRQLINRNSFFIGAEAQMGGLVGYGGAMGFYAGNYNFEGFYLLSGAKETTYWTYSVPNSSYPSRPVEEEFKVNSIIGGRVGYGFIAGTRMRFTPQLGGSLYNIKGDSESGSHIVSATAGLKIEFALSRNFGLHITPEYHVKVVQGDVYKALAETMDSVKKWGEGFNCKAGLFLFF